MPAPAPNAATPPAPGRPADTTGLAALPPLDSLRSLDEFVALGYQRGILRKLDEIERLHPDCVDFVAQLRELARQFQLDAIAHLLRRVLQEQPRV